MDRDRLSACGIRHEVAWFGRRDRAAGARTIILLHEGLGCVSTWRDFPERVARETRLSVMAYSRAGYGGSDPVTVPRPLDYMEREGRDVLPALLDAAGIGDALLVGHSDGGSIALVYAAQPGARAVGLVLLAPHVVCEDVSVRAIADAREHFVHGDLRARLLRHHGANTDVAFWGWNRAWLDPGFRAFDLTGYLPSVRVPTVVIQGDQDPYGTLAQVELVCRGVAGPCERMVLPGAGHVLHRERPDETVRAIVELAAAMA